MQSHRIHSQGAITQYNHNRQLLFLAPHPHRFNSSCTAAASSWASPASPPLSVTDATGCHVTPVGHYHTPHVAHIAYNNRLANADHKGLIADVLRIVLYFMVVIGSCILTWIFIVDALDRFHDAITMSSRCNHMHALNRSRAMMKSTQRARSGRRQILRSPMGGC